MKSRTSNGAKVPLLSRDKGTIGQAQNLAKGKNGSLSKSGTGHETGWYEILTACPDPQDKMGQSRKGRIKQKKDVLKQEMKL